MRGRWSAVDIQLCSAIPNLIYSDAITCRGVAPSHGFWNPLHYQLSYLLSHLEDHDRHYQTRQITFLDKETGRQS
jgi:hypothetical protein